MDVWIGRTSSSRVNKTFQEVPPVNGSGLFDVLEGGEMIKGKSGTPWSPLAPFPRLEDAIDAVKGWRAALGTRAKDVTFKIFSSPNGSEASLVWREFQGETTPEEQALPGLMFLPLRLARR